MSRAHLYRLMTWLSPAYPVGSFSYSHGLEAAIAEGRVADRATLEPWIAALLRHGAGLSDAALFRAAHAAAGDEDWTELGEIAALGAAMTATAELRLQTLAQGQAFLAATRDAWICAGLDRLDADRTPFPVAVATACAGHGVPEEDGLFAYLCEFSTNLVSAGVRLIPLGQRDGQRAIAALEPRVEETAAASRAFSLDTVGGATPWADLLSMRHETQYTRLFRS